MPIHPTAFIHERATVIGDVTLGAHASVWPAAVLRGDTAPIVVGADSNVQDGVIIHVDAGVPASIGQGVAIGHGAIIHGATVENECLIAMGAILLNHVRVEHGSVIAAGAICPEGMHVPAGSVVMGVPARVVRRTTDEMRERIRRTVASYLALQEEHRRGAYRVHR